MFGLTPQYLSLDTVQRGDLPGLEPSTPIYLVCERGQVSELAGLYLEAAGFTAVYHLAGGTRAWAGLNALVRAASADERLPGIQTAARMRRSQLQPRTTVYRFAEMT